MVLVLCYFNIWIDWRFGVGLRTLLTLLTYDQAADTLVNDYDFEMAKQSDICLISKLSKVWLAS